MSPDPLRAARRGYRRAEAWRAAREARRFTTRLRHDPGAPELLLSPHLDDAVLDCWDLLSAVGRGRAAGRARRGRRSSRRCAAMRHSSRAWATAGAGSSWIRRSTATRCAGRSLRRTQPDSWRP